MKYILRKFSLTSTEINSFKWLIKAYIWPYRKNFVIIWVSIIIATFASSTVIMMIKPALQASVGDQPTMSIILISSIIILASIIAGISQFVQTIILEKTSLDIVAKLRRDLFHHILNLDVSYLMRNHAGQLSAICMEETSSVKDATGRIFVTSIQDIFRFNFSYGDISEIWDDILFYTSLYNPRVFDNPVTIIFSEPFIKHSLKSIDILAFLSLSFC